MADGSVQTLLVCVPDEVGAAPCPAGSAPSILQAYVIHPSQGANIQAQFAPFDYAKAGEIYSFAFCSVVLLWATTKGIGAVINMVKS